MALALWYHAKTSADIARAVFSGVRTAEAMNFITRIASSTGMSKEARAKFDFIFAQLRDINSARNDILHFGATDIAEGQSTVTNALKALTEEKITAFPISPTILNAMTEDLRKIAFHLYVDHMGRPAPSGALSLMILQAPWRYKHSVQQKSRGKMEAKSAPRRKPGPKPPHQPRSSQG